MSAPAQLSESESAVVREAARLVRAIPLPAREAAARLAHRLSDKAAWEREKAKFRAAARSCWRQAGWTRDQKRAECRRLRPSYRALCGPDGALDRPYWRLPAEGKRLLLDKPVAGAEISVPDAWDTVLAMLVLLEPELDAAPLGLDQIATWRRPDGLGRINFIEHDGWSDANVRAEAFARVQAALAKIRTEGSGSADDERTDELIRAKNSPLLQFNSPFPITAEHLVDFRRSVRQTLTNPMSADSVRLECGLLLLRHLGMERYLDTQQLPAPGEDKEVAEVWEHLYAPIQRLSALAESKGIDSTPLRRMMGAQSTAELEDVESLRERLELIECGPLVGDTPEERRLLASAAVLRVIIKRASASLAEVRGQPPAVGADTAPSPESPAVEPEVGARGEDRTGLDPALWISSSDLKDVCGIETDRVAMAAKRKKWKKEVHRGLNWFLRADVRAEWPDLTRGLI